MTPTAIFKKPNDPAFRGETRKERHWTRVYRNASIGGGAGALYTLQTTSPEMSTVNLCETADYVRVHDLRSGLCSLPPILTARSTSRKSSTHKHTDRCASQYSSGGLVRFVSRRSGVSVTCRLRDIIKAGIEGEKSRWFILKPFHFF